MPLRILGLVALLFVAFAAPTNAALLEHAQVAPASVAVSPGIGPSAPALQSRASAPEMDWASSAPK